MFETNNNIFQAIDTIISQRLNEMKYDKTIVCEIIQKKDNGEYIVFDNTTKFTAYAEKDKEYFENQKVYVIVPQDNYTMKKIIIGHYSSDNDKMAYEFLNPFENVVDITGNLAAAAIPSEGVELSTEGQTASFTFSIGNIADNLSTLKYIGLKTNITTVMPDTHEGQYGILLTLIDTLDNVDSFIFDSPQMYGNPYYYDEGFDLEKVFVYPEGKTYTEGTIQFYSEVDDSVIFNDTYVCFGYDQSDFTTPVLSIKPFDDTDLEYTNDGDIVKIFATLIDKDSEGKYYRRNIDNKISWYKYTLGHSNDGIGNHWQRIEYADGPGPLGEFDNNNTFAEGITFPSTKNQFEQIVAAYKFDDNNTIKSNALSYEYTGNASSDLTELYHIELTNDSATVSAPLNTAIVDTEDNKFLENITKTEVQLYYGNDLLTGNDLPDGVAYKWSLSGDINEDVFYSSTDTSEFYFTGIGEETTSIKASVEVRISEILIGTKSFNFSVVRNGATAVAYKLIPSRNTVHEEDGDKTITFTVQKITGGTISTDFTESYFILPKGTSSPLGTDNKATVTQTTTFELYVGEFSGNATIWDAETIGYVENGSAGRGISEVINWYAATNTNDPSKISEGDWKKSISETGHGSNKPYLWNYEEIKYSDGSPSTITDVALLSNKPRSIASITEYYYVSKPDEDAPDDIIYDGTDTPPNTTGWKTAPPDYLASREILWNCEVIKYTTTDEEGKNLYQVNPKQQVGYVGEDGTSPYFIELTNDSATIGAAAGEITGETLEKATTTTVKVFEGKNEIISGLTYSWSVDGGNIDNKDDDPATIYFTKINNNVDSATATVTVKYNGIELQKTFSVSVARRGDNGDDAISYRLIVSPNTVKSSSTQLTFTVQKITGGNVENLKTGYTISPSTTTISETTTFNLKIGDSTWDSETVGFVSDGAPGEKGDTGKGVKKEIVLYTASTTAPNIPTEISTPDPNTGEGKAGKWYASPQPLWKAFAGDSNYKYYTSIQTTWTDNSITYTTPIEDSSASTIGAWCDKEDTILMNGGSIAAGSIDADKIAANSITANHIQTNAIKSDKIEANAITASKMATIAGFNFEDSQIYGETEEGFVGISAKGSNAFWAGSVESDETNFSVSHQGYLNATGATIEGVLTATSGTFNNCTINDTCNITKINAVKGDIGGITISNNSISSTSTTSKISNDKLMFNTTFRAHMNGNYANDSDIHENLQCTVSEYDGDDSDPDRWFNYCVPIDNGLTVSISTPNEFFITKQIPEWDDSYECLVHGKNGYQNYIYTNTTGKTVYCILNINPNNISSEFNYVYKASRDQFILNNEGLLTCSNANIKGKIEATEGYFSSGCKIGGEAGIMEFFSGLMNKSEGIDENENVIIEGTPAAGLKCTKNGGGFYVTEEYAWMLGPGTDNQKLQSLNGLVINQNKQLNYRDSSGFLLSVGRNSAIDSSLVSFYSDNSSRLCINSSCNGINIGNSNQNSNLFGTWTIAGGITISTGSTYREIYGSWALKLNSGTNNNTPNLLDGPWHVKQLSASSSTAITSDQKKKHEIESLTFNYSNLFDNLSPITYKYNDGTSDRKHVGFIAQQVGQALEVANISTQDFAGLVIDDKDNWYLRYDEFIALNTWQIQKLKSRVAELEQEIATLKNK